MSEAKSSPPVPDSATSDEPTPEEKKPAVRATQLTADQRAAALQWFQDTMAGKTGTCSLCGSDQWTLLDDFVAPALFGNDGTSGMFLGSTYPHFMLACATCANVQFVNAIASGVIAVPKKRENST